MRLDVERAEVDPQHVRRRRDSSAASLVEQAGLRAHPLVLDPRAQLGQRLAGPPAGLAAEQRERERGLERGGGGEPAAAREVAGDRQVRGRERRSPAARSSRDHPAHEGAPARGAVSGVERELVVLAEVERVDLEAARAGVGGDRDAALDRERHREPVVVVGVLADQVDAAGAEGDDPLRHRAAHASPDGLRALVDQQVAAAELGRDGAERARAGERVQAQVARAREDACTKRRSRPSGFCVG